MKKMKKKMGISDKKNACLLRNDAYWLRKDTLLAIF